MRLNRYFEFIESHWGTVRAVAGLLAWLIVILKIKQVFNHEAYTWAYTWPVLLNGVMAVSLAGVAALWPKFKPDRVLLGFCGVALLSIVVNDPPGWFESYQRWCLLVMMLCLLSPLVRCRSLDLFRGCMWRAVIVSLRAVVIVSFFLQYIPYEVAGAVRGAFSGPFAYPMMASPLAAFVAVDSAYRVVCRRLPRGYALLYCGLFAMALLEMVAAGSRCAILGAGCGAVVIFVCGYKSWKRILAVMSVVLVAGFVMLSVPTRTAGTVIRKNELAAKHNSVTASRDELWLARISEFKEKPVLGIGLGVSTHYSPTFDRSVDPEKGITRPTEPGSSWLSVLSNTGIIGLVLLLWFNVRLAVKAVKDVSAGNEGAVLLLALLVFYAVHGCFEGWMLYGGSLTFFIYWLLTSQISCFTNVGAFVDRNAGSSGRSMERPYKARKLTKGKEDRNEDIAYGSGVH